MYVSYVHSAGRYSSMHQTGQRFSNCGASPPLGGRRCSSGGGGRVDCMRDIFI
jgi:hypothetical protein